MRNFFKTGWLLMIVLMIMTAAVLLAGDTLFFIPGGSQKTTSIDYVVPVITNPSSGHLTPATATFSIPADTAVQVPTLPAGTKRYRIYVQPGADANFGPASVASGTTYPPIASGSLSEYFYPGTTTPTTYCIGREAAATGTILCE
jgi:hypothetical protein